MRKTKNRDTTMYLAVDIDKLAGMLSCGEVTARQIGEDAGARINIGRRVLYCVSKVESYLNSISS